MYNKCDDSLFHTIKSGDTFYSLSRLYNVPLIMIMKANPDVDIYNLQIGSKVCIPGNMNLRMQSEGEESNETKEFAYLVKPGETVTDIMNKFNVKWEDILKLNKPEDILLKPGISIILPLDD